MSYPTYFESFDVKAMLNDYPIGDAFLEKYSTGSKDELQAFQNQQFMKCVKRAWEIPFYQRLWGNAGVKPEDIQSIKDIEKLPVYSKTEIMDSVAAYPPFGDMHGMDFSKGDTNHTMVLHTTSGTTGRPQPLFFSPKSREVQGLLLGRIYRMQGLKPHEIVHSVYGHGLINGGHYVREGVTHYTNAIFMSAGTGVETRSKQQVNLMKDFGTNVIIGFADYIKKLADTAKEEGIVPGKDIPVRMISGHMGRESRDAISKAWGGAEIFDWYGVGDTGAIAGEGPDHDGLYVMEDAHYIEVCEPDTNKPLPKGDIGNLIVTCLYKDDIFPVIRFNTCDVTRIKTSPSKLGLDFDRIEGFLGRSDNMVKLRGINIYPQGFAPILEKRSDFAGDYICIADRDSSGRDELLVKVEVNDVNNSDVVAYQALLKQSFGVEMQVELTAKGELAPLTQTEVRQKPIRLIDNRFK